MHRPPPQSSPKLASLLDQRDHAQILMSLARDELLVDQDKVAALSSLLKQIEREIAVEQKRLMLGSKARR